ncbi:MAG: hypothetical protein M1822_000226 [Bathelium mastoideum]|nr:MAG: hypothetical protein M1822_000226 [Bathelium mastoideum]
MYYPPLPPSHFGGLLPYQAGSFLSWPQAWEAQRVAPGPRRPGEFSQHESYGTWDNFYPYGNPLANQALTPEMNFFSHDGQQPGAHRSTCGNQIPNATETLLDDPITDPADYQEHVEPSNPLSFEPSMNQVQPRNPETSLAFEPEVTNDACGSILVNAASPTFDSVIYTPGSSSKVPSSISVDDSANINVDFDMPDSVSPCSEEDAWMLWPRLVTTAHPLTHSQRSSNPATPLSTGKTPSLSCTSERQPYLDGSPHASEKGSPAPTSRPSTCLQIPQRNKQKVNKRRKLNDDERKNAKMVRKMGACCDGNNPCERCKANVNSARNFFQPCCRSDLGTIAVVRHGNAQFDQRDAKYLVYHWVNVTHVLPKVLELDWFLPGRKRESPSRLQLSGARQYRLENERLDSYTWQSGGQVHEEVLPPYAIDDTDALQRRVVAFLERCEPWVQEYVQNDLCAKLDEISKLTYNEVFRWQERTRSKLVEDALRLQYYSLMCQGWGSLSGQEDLGIRRMDFSQYGPNTYEEFQSNGHRPIPQGIDHQIDVAMLDHMRTTEKRLMKALKQKIQKNQKRDWYEIYLTYFVLLTNLQYIYNGAVGYMNSQRQTAYRSRGD